MSSRRRPFPIPSSTRSFSFVFALLLWLTEAVPPFAVGLLIICFQLFAYGTPLMNSAPEDTQRYMNSFSSSVIFLMLGGVLSGRCDEEDRARPRGLPTGRLPVRAPAGAASCWG